MVVSGVVEDGKEVRKGGQLEVRAGLSRWLEVGGRLGPAGVAGDARIAFARAEDDSLGWDGAIGLSLGFAVHQVLDGDNGGISPLLDAEVPLLLGLRLGATFELTAIPYVGLLLGKAHYATAFAPRAGGRLMLGARVGDFRVLPFLGVQWTSNNGTVMSTGTGLSFSGGIGIGWEFGRAALQ